MTNSIPTYILTVHGPIPTPFQVTSFSEAKQHEPDGVYTVARTYHGDQVLLWDGHLDRLEESARLENMPVKLDRAALRAALRAIIQASGYPESRFRLTIPRQAPDRVYIAVEPHQPVPAKILGQGARVICVEMTRPNPAAKTTDWMSQRASVLADLSHNGLYEALLVSPDGRLLEGASSNFYAVKDGQLRTADQGVLGGIAQRVLFAVAPAVVELALQPINRRDLSITQEAMLTSSGRHVVPVVEIDRLPVGDGSPGPITTELSRRYDAWAEAHLATL